MTTTEGQPTPTTKMVIKNNGNIGIGIEVPTAQLHTTKSVRFEGLTPLQNPTNIVVADADGNLHTLSAANLLAQASKEDKDWLRADGTVPLTDTGDVNDVIYTKGYVGIGNFTTPLTIDDFEFTENVNSTSTETIERKYKLMPLNELESYIKENKHLPNIPTTEQVMKEGIELGEMNAKLLEKVEELTLHSIELNKKNEELSTQNKKLETTLELLLERVSKLEENKSSN